MNKFLRTSMCVRTERNIAWPAAETGPFQLKGIFVEFVIFQNRRLYLGMELFARNAILNSLHGETVNLRLEKDALTLKLVDAHL